MSLSLMPLVHKNEILNFFLSGKETPWEEQRQAAETVVSLSQTNREFNKLCKENLIAFKVLLKLKTAPIVTPDAIYDVINWLKEGNYVVIHYENYKSERISRLFHVCLKIEKTSEEIVEYLEKTRVVYLDVSWLPLVLDEGEWNAIIARAGFNECTCTLKKRLLDSTDVPHGHQVYLA